MLSNDDEYVELYTIIKKIKKLMNNKILLKINVYVKMYIYIKSMRKISNKTDILRKLVVDEN